MAETPRQTKRQDAGDAIASSRSKSPVLGVSDVQDAKRKITLNDDELSALGASTRGASQCKIEWILSQVDDAQVEQLKKVFDNPTSQATKIANLLINHGFPISHSSILRHRKRLSGAGCRCPK